MPSWEPKSISDVVSEIHDDKYVLPVIQRRLVWKESQMELLFDSIMKGNAFGGIMVLEEKKGTGSAPILRTPDLRSIMDQEGCHGSTTEVFSRVQTRSGGHA